MNKCPRCENENLKEEYNYCPVCGRVINQTAKEAAIEMLKTMRDFHIEKECHAPEDEDIKLSCVGALELAIRELERTAPEVPVQEQLKAGISIDEKVLKDKLSKIKNFSEELKEEINSIPSIIKITSRNS
ncbi:MAG: hypothetical protein ACLR60_10855 [Clostridium paraputrificum]